MQAALHREQGTGELGQEVTERGYNTPQYPSHFGNAEGSGRNETGSMGGKWFLHVYNHAAIS